jgi:hypothetical protein
MGRPNAVGTTTELPRSEKFDTRTNCKNPSSDEATNKARLSGDIPRLYIPRLVVFVEKRDSESTRSKIGSYRTRTITPVGLKM